MHVKPFVPLRSVRIPPFGSGATMVAFSATFLGAAFIALAINSSSVGADLAPSAPWCIAGAPSAGGSAAHANALKLKSAAPAQSKRMDLFIDVSSLERFYLDVVSNLPPLTSTYCKYASAGHASRGFGWSELQRIQCDLQKGVLRLSCQPQPCPSLSLRRAQKCPDPGLPGSH